MTVSALRDEIEKAALWAWPPQQTASVYGWLLRSSSDVSNRTNSASTLTFDAGGDPGKAIACVEDWYAGQGKIPVFQLFDTGLPGDLDDLLARRSYRRITPSEVLARPAVPVPADSSIGLETRPTAGVMNTICDPLWPAPVRAGRAALFNRLRRPHVFALLHVAGVPASTGLCVRDGEWAGIFGMRTQTEYRGRGFARAVLNRLLGWAADTGARRIYLQVESDNEAALALYRSVGFEPGYRYWYRKKDQPPTAI